MKRGYEFNNPLIAVVGREHAGSLPKIKSFLSVQPKNVMITAAKKAEHSADIVLRLCETDGVNSATSVKLDLNRPIQKAHSANLLEDEISPVKVDNDCVRLDLRQGEIATIKIRN